MRKATVQEPSLKRVSADVPPDIRIGLRVRHARLGRGLRLRDVAERADCSESLVSKIENDRIVPSLNLLHRILAVLDLTVGEIFSRAHEPGGVVSRAGERPVVAIDPLRQGPGIRFERLIPYDPAHLLQGSIHLIAPGGGSAGLITHDGEEVGYVLEGQLEFFVGGETYLVEAGDSLCFRSELPHGYRNVGAAAARLILVNTPPSF